MLEEWSDLLKHADIAAFFDAQNEEEQDCSLICPVEPKTSSEPDFGGPQP